MTARELYVLGLATVGALANAHLFLLPKRCIPAAVFLTDLAWLLLRLLTLRGMHTVAATFFCSLLVGVAAQGLARHYRAPVQCFSVPGILPLAPGLSLCGALYAWTDGKYPEGYLRLAEAGQLALALALGLVVVSALTGLMTRAEEGTAPEGLAYERSVQSLLPGIRAKQGSPSERQAK